MAFPVDTVSRSCYRAGGGGGGEGRGVDVNIYCVYIYIFFNAMLRTNDSGAISKVRNMVGGLEVKADMK